MRLQLLHSLRPAVGVTGQEKFPGSTSHNNKKTFRAMRARATLMECNEVKQLMRKKHQLKAAQNQPTNMSFIQKILPYICMLKLLRFDFLTKCLGFKGGHLGPKENDMWFGREHG